MYETHYLRAASLEEALAFLLAHPEARPLAGGMTLLPTLKQRLAAPSHLVDLTHIEALKGIGVDHGVLKIGAATPHAQVASSALVARAIPALAKLAGLIADPQVRNRGTIGGSVANNDPAADYPCAALGLGATIVTSERKIPADEFFVGMFETALRPAELVVAIEFPLIEQADYLKHRHPASGYAITGVFISRLATQVRVAITGAGPAVFRWHAAEERLAKDFSVAALDGLRADPAMLLDDLHAPQRYRANLVEVHTRRLLAHMTGKAITA